MNSDIMKKLFPKEVEAVEKNICPFCKTEVDVSAFRDRKSKAEYHISGICMGCQDKIFGV